MGDWSERSNSPTKVTNRLPDRVIAEIARRQHGVISIGQLRHAGLAGHQIKHRTGIGRLHRIRRGVYAIGHRNLSRHGRWKAATLVAEEACLSHRSAAELWGMVEPRGGAIHITAPRKVVGRPGLRPHRASRPRRELTIREGIAVTSVGRTLLDLAAAEGRRPFERALREATFLRLPGRGELPALIARYRGAPGTAVAARALATRLYAKRIRSDLEADFIELLEDRGLPLPETNVVVAAAGQRFEVDCLWRAERLIFELDGGAAHEIPEQRELDLLRDGLLQLEGFDVHRVSRLRFDRDRDSVESQVCAALRLRPAA
jgi:very-short-patch-repair endonuclease